MQVHLQEQIVIDTPAASAWDCITRFTDVGWHPAVRSCVGTDQQRELVLQGGARIVERVLARDAPRRMLSYMLVEGPLPVADYEGAMEVDEMDAGCVVRWRVRYTPQADADAVAPALREVLRGGLAGLKDQLER